MGNFGSLDLTIIVHYKTLTIQTKLIDVKNNKSIFKIYIIRLFWSTFCNAQTAKFSIRTLIQTFLQEFLNETVKKKLIKKSRDHV